MKSKILAVIPARGGSKGIPDKNINLLRNKPLIYYTICEALKSRMLTDFIVSTDSKKIKEVSEHYGAKVPFLRPDNLSHDNALAIPTIQHAVKYYEKIVGFEYDIILMLQPTAPLRTAKDIDVSLKKLIDSDADSVISVVDVDNYHPYKMKKIKGENLHDYVNSNLENPPRQELPKLYIVNGAIYATRRNIFILENTFKGKKCIPYIMPQSRSINIDRLTDFLVADYYLKRRKKWKIKT